MILEERGEEMEDERRGAFIKSMESRREGGRRGR